MLRLKNIDMSVRDGVSQRHLFSISDLSLQASQLILCHGPSGSGKTSFLEVCAGLHQTHQGTVYWHDDLIVNVSDYHGQMCYMTSAPGLFHELSIHDNLLLPLKLKGQHISGIDDKIHHYSTLLSLGGLEMGMSPSVCSSGEKMRISLMRSLLQEPSVLYLDEPTANCDPGLARVIFSFLQSHAKEHDRLIVMASHDMTAREYAHEVVDMAEYSPVPSGAC